MVDKMKLKKVTFLRVAIYRVAFEAWRAEISMRTSYALHEKV